MLTQEVLNKKYKKGWYDYLCSEKFKIIYEHVCDQIAPSSPDKILDVGCWDGMFYKVLQETGYKNYYLGLDLCSAAINIASKRYGNKNTEFMTWDWNEELAAGEFDAIYLGGVLYYIEDKIQFVERFVQSYNPKIIAIQDLQQTDLSCFDKAYSVISTEEFYIDVDKNEARKKRQVKILKL